MIKIDMKDVESMERSLRVMTKHGLPIAEKNTINKAADLGKAAYVNEVESKLILRNPFTKNSIRTRKATSLFNPESAVGSIQPYLERQETGGTIRPKDGASGVSIPTGEASGERGVNVSNRRKLPSGKNKIQNIRNVIKGKGRTRKQRNIDGVRKARAAKGGQFVLIETSKVKGIFKVTGTKKKPKIRMFYDIKHKTINTPKNPLLVPAIKSIKGKVTKQYTRELQRQLIRAFR